jgi:hypothetical protein
LFLQLNPCSHSPYVTSFLTWAWVYQLWKGFAFVKRTYCTYSMLLKSVSLALYQVLYQPRLRRPDHDYLILCYIGSLVIERPYVPSPPNLSLLYFPWTASVV